MRADWASGEAWEDQMPMDKLILIPMVMAPAKVGEGKETVYGF